MKQAVVLRDSLISSLKRKNPWKSPVESTPPVDTQQFLPGAHNKSFTIREKCTQTERLKRLSGVSDQSCNLEKRCDSECQRCLRGLNSALLTFEGVPSVLTLASCTDPSIEPTIRFRLFTQQAVVVISIERLGHRADVVSA